jgi:hypothetical protein
MEGIAEGEEEKLDGGSKLEVIHKILGSREDEG